MINLAKLDQGETILDPFCGYGTILQAAVLKHLKVYGSDKDEECIISSEKNLEWLKEKYKIYLEFHLKKIDVLEIDKEFEEIFHGIVSEPYLGPALKKSITIKEAEEIISDLKKFYQEALEKLSKILISGRRIVIVMPVIITKEKRFKMNLDINGLMLVKRIEDIEPKHITGREIFIFEKVI